MAYSDNRYPLPRVKSSATPKKLDAEQHNVLKVSPGRDVVPRYQNSEISWKEESQSRYLNCHWKAEIKPCYLRLPKNPGTMVNIDDC